MFYPPLTYLTFFFKFSLFVSSYLSKCSHSRILFLNSPSNFFSPNLLALDFFFHLLKFFLLTSNFSLICIMNLYLYNVAYLYLCCDIFLMLELTLLSIVITYNLKFSNGMTTSLKLEKVSCTRTLYKCWKLCNVRVCCQAGSIGCGLYYKHDKSIEVWAWSSLVQSESFLLMSSRDKPSPLWLIGGSIFVLCVFCSYILEVDSFFSNL